MRKLIVASFIFFCSSLVIFAEPNSYYEGFFDGGDSEKLEIKVSGNSVTGSLINYMETRAGDTYEEVSVITSGRAEYNPSGDLMLIEFTVDGRTYTGWLDIYDHFISGRVSGAEGYYFGWYITLD